MLRYKACCNTCRYKILISRHTAAFNSSLRRQCRCIWANAGGCYWHAWRKPWRSQCCARHTLPRGTRDTAAAPQPAVEIITQTSQISMKKATNEWINHSHAAYKSYRNQIHISWDVKIVWNVIRNLVNRLWKFNSACIVGYPARHSWHKQRVVSVSYVTQWGAFKEFKFSQLQSEWWLG
jgi:hypothetical protein